MSGAESEIGGDELDPVVETEDMMSLTHDEIEGLERLTYDCRTVEYKKEKFSVDARRGDNWLSLAARNGHSGVQISFVYDVQNRTFATLQGASIEWVKDFLKKYRILED